MLHATRFAEFKISTLHALDTTSPTGVLVALHRGAPLFCTKHPEISGMSYWEALEYAGPSRRQSIRRRAESRHHQSRLSRRIGVPPYRAPAVHFADRILKDVKPLSLRFERLTRLRLVFTLRTAKALGLMMAPSIMVRAD
jgi:hypothetical protein